jgi:ubiquinone/menaquinone biosynthesis C-methylase UbiE
VESYLPNIEVLKINNIEHVSMNMESDKLPFPDGSIDLVLTNQFLEHTKEIFWIMHEVSRVLKPGGHLIVGVPNLASLHNRLLLLFGRQPTCIQNASAHVRGYTKSDFKKFLSKPFPGGFNFIAFKGSNFYPFPPVIAKPLARIFPNLAWGITMLFQKQTTYRNEYLSFPTQEKLETNFFLGKP